MEEQATPLMDPTRIEETVEKATEAFFAAVAAEYPEIKTGDFGPLETFEFEESAKEAVTAWVSGNRPYDDDEEEEG